MAKGLGNNPLGAGGPDPLIRDTTKHGTGLESRSTPPRTRTSEKKVLKSFSFPHLLNERLRQYCFDKRTKEAKIVRDLLHKFLSEEGY